MRTLLFFALCACAATTVSCLASGGSSDGGAGNPSPEAGADTTVNPTPTPEAGPAETGSPAMETGSPEVGVTSTGYTVRGPTIYDSSGNPHLFHGIDRPSLEFSTTGQWNGENLIPASDFVAMNNPTVSGWK